MKYPNPKFTGMSMVTSSAINAAILDYYPNKFQRGGAARLALLKKITTLGDLIDFCIESYRAWADSVLMKAGAYLKIGNYSDEIAEAKRYISQEVFKYLSGKPFLKEKDFDEWHKRICTTLADNTKCFQSYSAYRQTSSDQFKNNRVGFTIGNAQKFLNMVMKDLYACLSVDSTYLPNYKDYFTFCHMPLDSYILRFVDDIRHRQSLKRPTRTCTWSSITSYEDYMKEQTDIRAYVSATATVLETEFVVWPLYK